MAPERDGEGGRMEAARFRVDKRVGLSTPGLGVRGDSGFRFGDSSVLGDQEGECTAQRVSSVLETSSLRNLCVYRWLSPWF